MADVNIKTTRVALDTSASGTQDITISGFGTPKAAIFILSGATADDTLTNGGVLSIGYTDGTRTKAQGLHTENTGTTTNTASAFYNSCVVVPDVSGSGVDADFGFSTWITDGVRLSIDGQADAAWLLTVILINGDDVSNVYVGDYDDLGSGTGAIDITDPGFEPDIVFMGNIASGATADWAQAIAFASFGIGINDGADTQRSITFNDYDGQGTAINTGVVSNDSITGAASYSGMSWEASIGTYDASGFSITPEASAAFTIIHYLAIKFTNSPNIDLFDVTIPTTGNYAETTPAFEPGFGLLCTMMGPSARNTATTSGLYGVSLSAFDGTNIYTTSISSDDGAVGDTSSMSADRLRTLDDDGTDGVIASFDGFDSLGWDFTISTHPAAALLGFGLAIEGAPADTNISATTDTLTITTYQATVDAGIDTEVSVNTDALSITTYSASIDLDFAIQTASLTLTTYAATIGNSIPSSANTGAGGIAAPIMRRLVKKEREKRKKKEALEVNDHELDVAAAIDQLLKGE